MRPRADVIPWSVAFAVALHGCAHSTPSPSQRQEPSGGRRQLEAYAMLRVGVERTYEVDFQGQTGRRTVKTVRKEGPYFVDDAGGALALSPNGLRDRDRYLVRLPLEPGTEWSAVQSASAVERYTIRSVDQPCTLRAGRFEACLTVVSRLRRDARMTLEARWTWVRGIGLARVETVAILEGRRVPQTRQDLIHYDLAPATNGGNPVPPPGRSE